MVSHQKRVNIYGGPCTVMHDMRVLFNAKLIATLSILSNHLSMCGECFALHRNPCIALYYFVTVCQDLLYKM